MKKFLIVLGLIIFIASFLFIALPKNSSATAISKEAYVRIHIRANSNSSADQEVKYKVKNAVVDFLTPIISECSTVSEAHNAIAKNLPKIDSVADKVLKENGFYYGAHSKINDEYFPTRAYDDLVLDEGIYDALIVELGQGVGDNWWCVVYPPLCFIGAENTGTNSITYKSKIVEILKNLNIL
ncbi:MAG: stage II sporulation protein R [bacterium]|nr:stage II sporulation protein R [bacterium]